MQELTVTRVTSSEICVCISVCISVYECTGRRGNGHIHAQKRARGNLLWAVLLGTAREASPFGESVSLGETS